MKYFLWITLVFASAAWGKDLNPVSEAVEKLKALNLLREGLAGTLDGRTEPITADTFKQVCAPVGKALKAWGKDKGYKVSQVSEKYRNPTHAPVGLDGKVIEKFKHEPGLNEYSEVVKGGTQVYVRIPVVSSCLHCHGEKEARPEFVKAKYKDDKAFGFKVGDLRGLYSVFIPAK